MVSYVIYDVKKHLDLVIQLVICIADGTQILQQ